MSDVKKIMNDIVDISSSNLSNDQKHEQLSFLWELVWQQATPEMYPEIYNLYLLNENTSFLIDQKPIMKHISSSLVIQAIENFKKNHCFTDKEVKVLLDFSVNHARDMFSLLGANVSNSSLNGFCELGQALTIMPFEELGLDVTKNKAEDCFGYPYHHCFGTVTFPVMEEEQVVNKTYLIDSTYRQCFATVRCHEGMYDAVDDLIFSHTPSPGYFVTDKDFAKTLMADGYIELTTETAKKYGEGFYFSSLEKGESPAEERNYFQNIFANPSDYVIKNLEGLTASFPTYGVKSL